jgi:DNA-binding MarR family transcriptional regulator
MRESGGEVSPQQHRLLTMLARRPRTLSEIARIQGVTPATATTMVTTLEHRGFVRREVDEADRRRVVVTMTELGAAALSAAQAVAEKAIAELLRSVDPQELAAMSESFDVVRRLGASEPSPAGR